jgi:transcriptional regulator with XRE-family HTH domain
MSRKKLSSNETFPGLSKRIKFLRGKRTQKEFGELLGISKATVSKYESGITIPSSDIFNKIASLGNMPIEWLLRGDQLSPTRLRDHNLRVSGAGPGPPMDVALLTDILTEIKNYIVDKSLKLLPQREARLVALIYDHCQEYKVNPDRGLVERFLWITRVD